MVDFVGLLLLWFLWGLEISCLFPIFWRQVHALNVQQFDHIFFYLLCVFGLLTFGADEVFWPATNCLSLVWRGGPVVHSVRSARSSIFFDSDLVWGLQLKLGLFVLLWLVIWCKFAESRKVHPQEFGWFYSYNVSEFTMLRSWDFSKDTLFLFTLLSWVAFWKTASNRCSNSFII